MSHCSLFSGWYLWASSPLEIQVTAGSCPVRGSKSPAVSPAALAWGDHSSTSSACSFSHMDAISKCARRRERPLAKQGMLFTRIPFKECIFLLLGFGNMTCCRDEVSLACRQYSCSVFHNVRWDSSYIPRVQANKYKVAVCFSTLGSILLSIFILHLQRQAVEQTLWKPFSLSIWPLRRPGRFISDVERMEIKACTWEFCKMSWCVT